MIGLKHSWRIIKPLAVLLQPNMGSTNISGIPEALKRWVDSGSDAIIKEQRREQISEYNVILVVSDGHFNNDHSATKSLLDCQHKLKAWFDADPVIVIWDVVENTDWGYGTSKNYCI